MAAQSRHLSERIDRPADDVYAYARDPANLPTWASGLGSGIEEVGGKWYVDTDGGRLRVEFAERNAYRVLDHTVTLPSGEAFDNPMRVLADGDGCEVVFTLRRLPDVTDEAFERDAELIADDLARLKSVLEQRAPAPREAGR